MVQEKEIVGYAKHCHSARLYSIIHINNNGDYVLKAINGDVSIREKRQIEVFFEVTMK